MAKTDSKNHALFFRLFVTIVVVVVVVTQAYQVEVAVSFHHQILVTDLHGNERQLARRTNDQIRTSELSEPNEKCY